MVVAGAAWGQWGGREMFGCNLSFMMKDSLPLTTDTVNIDQPLWFSIEKLTFLVSSHSGTDTGSLVLCGTVQLAMSYVNIT